MKISALIPAKIKSERIPNKNLKKIGKFTLIENKIIQLLSSKKINKIFVGTNSNKIKKLASKYDVEIIDREDQFCGTNDKNDNFTANNMIHNFCSKIESDIVVWAHCTNPLVDGSLYDEAVNLFIQNEKMKKYDSLASVDRIQNHIFNKNLKPLNFNPYGHRHPLALELDPLFALNGAIFIQRHKAMLKNKYFFGKKPYLFEIPQNKSIDINNPEDLDLCKFYFKQNKKWKKK